MSSNPKTIVHYAYNGQFTEVEAVVRFSAVKRWHMIDTTRTQNLAEHSANVAALMFVMAMKCPHNEMGPAENAAAKALFHDMPEVFTGDIPTPTKTWLDKNRVHEMEESVTPRIFQRPITIPLEKALKVADLADGIRFIRVHGVDVTAQHARQGLEHQLWSAFVELPLHFTPESALLIISIAFFYAYETRIADAQGVVPADVRAVVDDLARRQGDYAGST